MKKQEPKASEKALVKAGTKKPFRFFGSSKQKVEELEQRVEELTKELRQSHIENDRLKRDRDILDEHLATARKEIEALTKKGKEALEIAKKAEEEYHRTRDEILSEVALSLGFKPPVGYRINAATLAAAFLAQKRKIEIDRQELDQRSVELSRQLEAAVAMQQIPGGSMTALGPGQAEPEGNIAQEKPQSEGDPNYRGHRGPRQKDFGPDNYREGQAPDILPELEEGDTKV